MTGLEKIIEHIRQDSDVAAGKIISDTQAEIDETLAKARKECDELSKKLSDKTQAELALAKSRGESAAALAKRKKLLAARQEIITETLESARKSLLELPDGEYFDMLTKMLDKYALKEPGNIVLTKKDKDRISSGFKAALESKKLTLSDKDAKIDGGFLLEYGDIEENCSFEALFEAEKEELQDTIKDLLFE
ncbi:MAG: V-type ATP synthase subunit E [Lachnospiraceae bacterium]|nr:V-type ATP synthase subunit E [Lachnospiraceae bacterium]